MQNCSTQYHFMCYNPLDEDNQISTTKRSKWINSFHALAECNYSRGVWDLSVFGLVFGLVCLLLLCLAPFWCSAFVFKRKTKKTEQILERLGKRDAVPSGPLPKSWKPCRKPLTGHCFFRELAIRYNLSGFPEPGHDDLQFETCKFVVWLHSQLQSTKKAPPVSTWSQNWNLRQGFP